MKSLHEATTNKKILIFDLDDTLVHLNIDWGEYISASKSFFQEHDPAIIEGKTSFNELHTAESLYFEKHGKDGKEAFRQVTEPIELAMDGFYPNEKLIDFMISHEDDFDEYYIWTSNHTKTAQKVLEELSLLEKFKKIISKDTVTRMKPNGEGFKYIYDDRYFKKDYLFLGNSLFSDKGAAEDAGIDFFHITHLL